MNIATVRKWIEERGFGFLRPDDGSPDLFVHYTAIAGTGHKNLTVGERVSYVVGENNGKRCAVSCVRLADENPSETHDDEYDR